MNKLLVLLALLSPAAFAQQVPLGEKVDAIASFCPTQEVAEAVVATYANKGRDQATQLFAAKCVSAAVSLTPEYVVSRTPVGSGTLKIIRILVVMQDNSEEPFYMITVSEVKGDV